MKHRLHILFGVSFLALTTTSCGFEDVFTVRLTKLTIADANASKIYSIGESYFDFADLTIKGTYSDGKVEEFAKEDVTFVLKCNDTTYDVYSPFTVDGTYKLTAKKDGKTSNALTITVLPEPEYVTALTPSGNHSVAINQTTEISLAIAPSNYTVPIEASIDDSSVAALTRNSDTSYTVRGVSVGSATITFRAHDSESTYLSETFSIDVTENYVQSISVSGQNKVAKQASINLSLTVNPSDFSVDISATSSDTSKATVEKNNNTSFKVNGIATGNVTITFKALKNASEYVEATYDVEVLNMAKTNIAQTYNTYSHHNGYGSVTCPLEGDVKLLVIPVWFTNSDSFINTSKKETIREDIRKAYFGTTSETGWHSVASFYEEESNGALRLTGTVSDWYDHNDTARNVNSYEVEYDEHDRPIADPQGDLIEAATDWYFENHDDSRRNYDSDGDGFLDSVMLIYAAPNYGTYSYSGGGENLWAYCYWIFNPQASSANPGVNVYFWASYDFMLGSNTASSHTGHNYYYGNTSHCSIDAHTYIHEMGHVLGLEDYYDYAGATSPAGGFSMQDHNVGGHDAFSVMAYGWADPYIPTTTCDITINDFQSSRDMILLTPSWNNKNSPFDEYLLLELYSPTGLNEFDATYAYSSEGQMPSGVGIRLWHVDARLMDAYGNIITDATRNSIYQLLNNTSDVNKRPCPGSYIDASYQNYNLLQLIRNDTNETYQSSSTFSNSDLFTAQNGKNIFTTSDFQDQFVDGTLLDKGESLGWSFTVNSIANNGDGTYSANIRVTRA